MNSNIEEHKCTHCDYKSDRSYNLKRHIVTKHSVQKTDDNVKNPDDAVQKTDDGVQKTDDSVQNTNIASVCAKCNKTFQFPCRLARHAITCKGVTDPYACDYCKKHFMHTDSKYRHHKICKVRIERESQALVPSTQESTSATINNNTTNTNIQNLNGNNIQNQTNNTVVNLVVYNSNLNESMQFSHAHIDPRELKKFLIAGDHVQPERLTGVVREWTQQLLSNNDNKCVKKTNIRSAHSSVHVGNNNWETRLDKEVYPHLMNNIANDFSDFFNDNYRNNMYKALEAFIEYMASDGYCSTDSDKLIENSYKTLVKELKLRTFDLSKRTVPTANQ